MRRRACVVFTILVGSGLGFPSIASGALFPGATETDEQLKRLYDDAGDVCLRNPSRDVRVAVACKSMTIYGLALNERGWCYGRQSEANAQKDWHRCGADSDRFSLDQLTTF
ncbi:hypothetical protein FG93_05353 [Bosea sp. LC85]|nr:hypothetical protein FG93_05353 [Bosea sp. LC85]